MSASTTPDGTAWDKAWREFQDASAAYRAEEAAYSKIHAAHAAAAPSVDMINWRAFHGLDRMDVMHRLDLDEHERKLREGEGTTWWGHPGAMDEKAESIDTVRQWRALRKANDERFDFDAASDRHEALCEAMCAAEDRLMMHIPAPDAAALLWKLEKLLQLDGDNSTSPWVGFYIEQTVADMRRLLPNGEVQR